MIAEVLLWTSLALIAYAYVGYGCALRVLAAVRSRRVRRAPYRGPVSFVITAHNEEARLRAKIANTLAQDYPASDLEVIVASDCSTDATDEIARSYGDRVRLVRSPVRRGKEAAQQLAVRAATGDILIFSDTATALAPDGVSTILRSFSDPGVGCVSSRDRCVDEDGRPGGESAYVRYEMRLRELETRVNSLVGLSGSFFAVRRDVCRAWSPDRQSDFTTLLNAVALGYRGVLDAEAVGSYRNAADQRREARRKLRTVVRGLAVLARHRGMLNPFRFGLFAWQLASHKLCRWLVPFAMVAALAGNAALASTSSMYRVLLAMQLAGYGAALAGLYTRASILRVPAFLLSSNVAILVAWWRFAAGERATVWNPTERLSSLPSYGATTLIPRGPSC